MESPDRPQHHLLRLRECSHSAQTENDVGGTCPHGDASTPRKENGHRKSVGAHFSEHAKGGSLSGNDVSVQVPYPERKNADLCPALRIQSVSASVASTPASIFGFATVSLESASMPPCFQADQSFRSFA